MDDFDARDRRNDEPLRDPTGATPPDAEKRGAEPHLPGPTGPERAGAGPHGTAATGAERPGARADATSPGATAPTGSEPRDANATTSGPRTLRRSRHDRIISGLSGGLGAFFGVDPTLFRIGFVLLAFAGGGGIILYLIMTLVVPSEDDPAAGTGETMRRGAEDLADSVKNVTDGLRTGENDRSRNVAAIVLILLGAFFLFRNLDWLNWFDAGWVWPVLLIGLGLWLLVRRR